MPRQVEDISSGAADHNGGAVWVRGTRAYKPSHPQCPTLSEAGPEHCGRSGAKGDDGWGVTIHEHCKECGGG